MKYIIATLILFFLNLGNDTIIAQVPGNSLHDFISNEKNVKSASLQYASLVLKFYAANNYKMTWLSSNSNRTALFNELDKCDDIGLEVKDYEYNLIQSIKSNKLVGEQVDSILADLRITDAAIHFYKDVKNGNSSPILKYDGLNYQPDFEQLLAKLVEYLNMSNLKQLVVDLQPVSKEYINARNKLLHFNKVMNDKDFKEVIITSNKVDSNNLSLKTKLYQLGITDTMAIRMNNNDLAQKLQSAQKLFSLLNDGALRSTTMKALNIPLHKRKIELVLALNYLRWLNEIKVKDKAIILNIPSATLLTYIGGEVVLDSRVIVGKPTTPTPTLSSRITEVIVYPYWNVPNNIATKELLPNIKRNIGYLEANNFQVLSKQGKILDPYKISWASLSAAYFPYLIRQSTGCDNSLGIIKLNFYNPYTVYLHDTPGKGLFFLSKRYFSHGCMRVEKAIELGKLLAKNHELTIQNIDEQGCLKSQAPIVLPTDEPVKILVLYSTVWYNPAGELAFCDDPYGKAN